MLRQIMLFLLCLLPAASFSQTDAYPGTWEMEGGEVTLTLRIGNPEKDVLYPAQLSIQTNIFTGTYELLLVKKNKDQLGISRNKKAISEVPFSLGTGTELLNNVFTYTKANGSYLMLQRLTRRNFSKPLLNDPDSQRTLTQILDFLQTADIRLKKKDPYPLRDNEEIVGPSSIYYGILDTVHFKTSTAKILIADNKKNDNDSVSVLLNGKPVLIDVDIRKKRPAEEIELLPGLNIVSFFADNYGKAGVNTGKLSIVSGKKKMLMDFNRPADLAATFIVAKLYYYPGNEDSIALANSKSEYIARNTLHRITKSVGQLETRSEQITLALWDDAVEDGDSISLNVNGKWLVRGFAVKKRTQFITVTLEPGPNKIIFIADNLGAISPNTSVLEIIDGRQRKSFKIETNYDKNNLINIFYDFNPER